MNSKLTMLGGLTAREFLHNYWQKKPLLIRQAFPNFKGFIDPAELFDLACKENVQARLVINQRGKFELHHPPLEPKYFSRKNRANKSGLTWTVLVQGVNHHREEGEQLLKHFSFIPHARLDDLMISYAPRGGGVGPHFDSYDVFLLQGLGHRRWQISSDKDYTLVEGAPLRILQNFSVEEEWVLEAGDMLYLPPHYAHNGIAEDACMTYSIGFRSPSYQELSEEFLVYLQDRIAIEGTYADPCLKVQRHASEIGVPMLKQVTKAIKQIRWDREDIANFLGCYLSEPKAHIFFDAPERPLSMGRFRDVVQSRGIRLDLKSLMLCCAGCVFINGEAHHVSDQDYILLRDFADERASPGLKQCPHELTELLYRWYLDGYISLN